jgi:hypothetical protein
MVHNFSKGVTYCDLLLLWWKKAKLSKGEANAKEHGTGKFREPADKNVGATARPAAATRASPAPLRRPTIAGGALVDWHLAIVPRHGVGGPFLDD